MKSNPPSERSPGLWPWASRCLEMDLLCMYQASPNQEIHPSARRFSTSQPVFPRLGCIDSYSFRLNSQHVIVADPSKFFSSCVAPDAAYFIYYMRCCVAFLLLLTMNALQCLYLLPELTDEVGVSAWFLPIYASRFGLVLFEGGEPWKMLSPSRIPLKVSRFYWSPDTRLHWSLVCG